MKRELSVADAKAGFSSIINSVAYGGERIVVLSHGKPKAAVIGIEDLDRLERAAGAKTGHEIIKAASRLRKRISSRGKNIVPSEIDLQEIRKNRAG